MKRYARIYRHFLASSLVRELEFRVNFFAKIFQNIAWLFFFVLILVVIFENTDQVAGWSRGEAFVLSATLFAMQSVFSAFCMSLMEIPEQVRKGTLDFVVTRPIDSQFWVSLRRFNFDQIGPALAGVVMLFVGLAQDDIRPDALQWLGYLVLFGCAVILFYSLSLMLMTLGIWLVRVDNLWVLGETVASMARYPVDIFNSSLQRMFTFFIPIALLSTLPSRQLVRGFDPSMLALGLLWAAVMFAAARKFWNFAMGSYSSASS